MEYARLTNQKYRSIGLGVSGYHHMLAKRGIRWESDEHLAFTDAVFELINYAAVKADTALAREKGRYSLFEGSDWQTGAYFEKRGYTSEKWRALAKTVAVQDVYKRQGVPIVCCGEPMSEIVPGTTDAAVEKHVPVWTVENGIVRVKVGSVEHPMLPEHYIEWVSLHTKQGNQRKELHPGEKPEVCFALCEGDEVEAVYAYCNLHSLWKA